MAKDCHVGRFFNYIEPVRHPATGNRVIVLRYPTSFIRRSRRKMTHRVMSMRTANEFIGPFKYSNNTNKNTILYYSKTRLNTLNFQHMFFTGKAPSILIIDFRNIFRARRPRKLITERTVRYVIAQDMENDAKS